MDFVFVALLRDNNLQFEDQDFEFPACFIIEAENKDKALSWCNNVTMEHCLSNPAHELVNTLVESPANYPPHVLETLPSEK